LIGNAQLHEVKLEQERKLAGRLTNLVKSHNDVRDHIKYTKSKLDVSINVWDDDDFDEVLLHRSDAGDVENLGYISSDADTFADPVKISNSHPNKDVADIV